MDAYEITQVVELTLEDSNSTFAGTSPSIKPRFMRSRCMAGARRPLAYVKVFGLYDASLTSFHSKRASHHSDQVATQSHECKGETSFWIE